MRAEVERLLAAPDNLTVVILDHAGAPGTLLVSAAEEARHVFRTVGVETSWIVCRMSQDHSQPCQLPPAGTYVQVNILPKALESGLPSCEGFACATKCPAAEGFTTSWVFYGRVLAYAENARGPVAVALAYAMVHEIGHLMGMGHSPCGIMKAHFDWHDLHDAAAGRLRFPVDDARRRGAGVTLWTGSIAPSLVAEAR